MREVAAGLSAALADRYRIERELGQGGMATVYLAHDVRHDREVAVKVLHPDLGAALGHERFLTEIRTTARLQHPHILPLLDSGNAAGQLYYVMPLVTGETLRARLAREVQLPVDDALRVAREVADALAYAHSLGVIHRDIKPENILLQNGHAIVADFGIALAVQQAGGQRLTQTGLSLGTPQYMSPEQATGERVIDARSDIYALGAVTYEMLVGEPPFTGPSVQAIVARVMTEEPRGLVVQRKAITGGVEDAVLRALEKLPADRFCSAAEFAAALGSHAATTPSPRARVVPKADTRLAALMSVLLMTLGAAEVWHWTRPQPRPNVIRYRITLDSVPAFHDWMGETAISPDGSVIVRTHGPNDRLLVRRRDQLRFTPMPGTEGAIGAFFSPDGDQVAYYANGKSMVVSLAEGPPTVLFDSVAVLDARTWGDDGYIYGSAKDAKGFFVLARGLAKRGSPWEAITTVDSASGEQAHYLPDALPNGKTVLFQIAFKDGRNAIGAVDLATKRHTVLMAGYRPRYSRDGHLLYATGEGRLWSVPFDQNSLKATGTPTLVAEGLPVTVVGVADFAVSSTGTLVYSLDNATARRELVWVSRAGARSPFDTAWKAAFSTPAISPDGSRLAVAVRDGDASDIWIKPMSGGSPIKLTYEGKSNEEPTWTADGRSVTYVSSGTAGNARVGDVVRQAADGSDRAATVLHSERQISEQLWSSRGDWLVVRTTTSTAGAGDILAVRADNPSTLVPIVATSKSEYTPTLSPDGKWLAYTTNETGRFEIFVVPFPNAGSAKRQVSTTGGISPRWSRRGGELFYLDLQSNLMAAQVTTSPTFTLQGTKLLFSAADFVLNGGSRRGFDVSPDDQRFLMVRRDAGVASAQVIVTENWFEDAKARARK
jgi:serine/threonine-protein kinase